MLPEQHALFSQEERILILMSTPKDALTTAEILKENNLVAFICSSLKELCKEIGIGASAAILTEEMIISDEINRLKKTLETQPAWSDFPLIMLIPGGRESPTSIKILESIGHMTLLQRPLQIAELLSTVKAALRDRKRQYETRHYVDELARQAAALKESEAQFRQLADSIPQLAWMADETGWLHWYNQRWYDYTGTTFEEIQGWGWQKVHDPAELERILVTWKEAVANGNPWEDTFPLRRHDGEMRWHLSRAHPITDNTGKIVRWFGTNTDITDQREALEKANAANIAKTEFLANMSHEIRTPMNAVIGLSALLAMSSPLTSKQQEFIKTLQLSADSLLALINDLLDIAKIESKSVELEKIPFNFAVLIEEIVSMMSVRTKEKGINFDTDIGPIEGKEFIGDPTRIRQILTNLCSNAVKFTEKGRIKLSIQSPVTRDERVMELTISVADTGIGISESNLPTIFDKFMQADSSINRKYGGTGLGLAITKTLVELMGGTITAGSTYGEGSTFTVFLPLLLKTEDTALLPEGIPQTVLPFINTPSCAKSSILLVEDYKANILVATTYLQGFGYSCDVAENGLQAIEKYKNGAYEVVLMDVQMHEMNGFQATRAIRTYEKQTGKKHVPIIGMTAHALAGDRERCIEAGMDDYISKPFNPEDLQNKLHQFFNPQEQKTGRILQSYEGALPMSLPS